MLVATGTATAPEKKSAATTATHAIGSLPLLRLKFSSHCKDVEGRERSRSRVRSAAARLESSIGLFSVDLGLCNYGGLIDTLFTDVEGVA